MLTFLFWHYQKALPNLLVIIGNLLTFLKVYFSTPVLLRTLFSPWKNEVRKYQGPGFNLSKIIDTWVFNSLSRIIGAIVRLTVLFVWLLSTINFLVLSLIILLLFIIFPFLSLPVYFFWQAKEAHRPFNLINKTQGNSNSLFKAVFTTEFSQFLFKRLEISLEESQSLFSQVNSSEEEVLFQQVLTTEPSWSIIFKALVYHYQPLTKLLTAKNIDQEDCLKICYWYQRLIEAKEKELYFWQPDNLQKIKSLAKDWAYGYTIDLDQFSDDLNKKTVNLPPMIGRLKEIEGIERILSKRKESNLLLIGEPGIGKKTIILNFAQRIVQGRTTVQLAYKRVLLFDLNSAISSEPSIEAKRAKLLSILNEAKEAGNIILVIDSFDKFVSSGEGRLDLTQVFSQAIGESDLCIISIVTPRDYQQYLQPNSALLKLFEKLEVFPPGREEALTILEDQTSDYEKRNKITVSYFALKEIVERVEVLISEIPFPEKAIKFLDEVVVYGVNNLKTPMITKEIVDRLLSEKTKIPLTAVSSSEKDKLLNLGAYLSERIIGQKEAVINLGKAMRRGRLKISSQNKPMGVFLFLGPTGVGKTETAKALSQLYFGSEEKMIRLDMAEFIGSGAIEKLIGRVNGQPGILTTAVRQNPFGVLLLDEFEKSTNEVLNLFLTVFDEGYLTDEQGKSVSFTNLIIIATSNAGAEYIRERVSQGIKNEAFAKELVEYVLKERIFRPEMINRFDSVIVFKPLTTDELKEIAVLLLKKFNEQLKKEQGIIIKITEELVNKIVSLGFNPTFGARPMRRAIQEEVEDKIAKLILNGQVKKGDEVEINL